MTKRDGDTMDSHFVAKADRGEIHMEIFAFFSESAKMHVIWKGYCHGVSKRRQKKV